METQQYEYKKSLDPIQALAQRLNVPKRSVEVILGHGEKPTIAELKDLCRDSGYGIAVVAALHRKWFKLCKTTTELENLFITLPQFSLLRNRFLTHWIADHPTLTSDDLHRLKKLALPGSDVEYNLLIQEAHLFLDEQKISQAALA